LSRVFKNLAIYLLIVLIAVTAFRWSAEPEKPEKAIDYSSFYQSLQQDKIKSVTIVLENSYYQISGTMKNDEKFKLTGPEDPSLINLLREHNVTIVTDPPTQPPLVDQSLVYILPDFAADWLCLLYDAADPRRWESGDAVWQKSGQAAD